MTRDPLRVLIIEDDPAVGRVIELILAAQGYTCIRAETGEGGLAVARCGRFDIILLDLSLPDLDGYAVLRILRGGNVRTPVLILSGSDRREDKIKGLGIGADDYVTKPFDKGELIARIHAILRRTGALVSAPGTFAPPSGLLARQGEAAPWESTAAHAVPKFANPAAADDAFVAELRPKRGPLRPPGTARIIVLGNAKGGTGKSTTAMHLIVALLRQGRRVGSLDLDAPQGTLSRYMENRRSLAASGKPELAVPKHHTIQAGDAADFEAVLPRLVVSCDDVVIDTPGHHSELSRRAHAVADVLITPLNDSFLDLDVLAQIEADTLRVLRLSPYGEMVHALRQQRRDFDGADIQWIVLRNRLSSLEARNMRNMGAVLRRLAEQMGFREGCGLSERVIYRELFLHGLTLLDLREKDIGQEFTLSHVAARREFQALLDLVQSPAANRITA